MEVHVKTGEDLSLLGYILKDRLERSLAEPGGATLARGIRGLVVVGAARMRTGLVFHDDFVMITEDYRGKAKTSLIGNLDAFLRAGAGRGFFGSWLKGDLKVAGDLSAALRILRMLVP